MNDPVLRYAEIKKQISLLNNEAEFLQPEVMKRIRQQAGNELLPVDLEVGTFVIARTKKWVYSSDYLAQEQALKERKEMEQATGLATFTEEEQLRFNINKE